MNVVAGVVGGLVGSTAWTSAIPAGDRLGAVIFSGPVAALVVWIGLTVGVLPLLRCDAHGIDVRNPMRRARIPWSALRGVRVSGFGLRLDTEHWSMPVMAAQLSNAARAVPAAGRTVTQLAEDLIAVRDHQLALLADAPAGADPQPSVRWVLPRSAVAIFLAYLAALVYWLYR